MLNTLTTALMILSSITGKQCVTSNVDLTKENLIHVADVFDKEYTGDTVVGIETIVDLYSANGANIYSLIVFDDGIYAVIDKPLNIIIESGVKYKSIYKSIGEDDIVVLHNDYHFLFDKKQSNFFCMENSEKMSNKYVCFRADDRYTYTPCKSTDYPNVTTIDKAFYFDNLNGRYGDNDSGICGIIAAQILLGYHDTFDNDNLVQEKYDRDGTYYGYDTQLSSWPQSPSTDEYLSSSTDSFRNYLIDESTDVNHSSPIGGMTELEVKRLIQSHCNNQDVSVTINYHTSHNAIHSNIQNAIDNDRPVIATLPSHFVVIYGYDTNYYYADTGWGSTARFPKTDFDFTDVTCGLIDLEFSQHVHSNNYYNNTTNQLLCGCGQQHSKRLEMYPDDWGFEEQYYFYVKNKNHTEDGISFTTQRYRTGYIQSSVINLSPRRQGAGNARFDIVLPKEIYNLKVEMSWWGPNENQNDGLAQIMYHEFGDDYSFWTMDYVNIHSLNLNQSHTYMKEYKIPMPADCDGIRFYLTNNAVGEYNRGRLSIGRVHIDYYE